MNFRSNKVKDIRDYYCGQMSKIYSPEESKAIVDLVFDEILGIKKTDWALNPGLRLSESEMLKIHFPVKQLLKNRPVQYVLQSCFFYGHSFYVDERVLIPRPETEELVDLILKNPHLHKKELNLLDIGTGSGCIAISLKLKLPDSLVWAMDISPGALEVAALNADTMGARVTFFQDDISAPAKIDQLPDFDLIVSNPPYVRQSEKMLMKPNVLDYEPSLALFVNDDDALVFYKNIISFSNARLRPKGFLYFEISRDFGDPIATLLKEAGFVEVFIYKDISGNDRMISAQKD